MQVTQACLRSSYGTELVSASHGTDESMPLIICLHELKHGVLSSQRLRHVLEYGGLKIETTLTIDAESVYKSLISADAKVPTEKTLYGHVIWLREQLQKGNLNYVQWCDTRDMSADGHTKGSIPRDLLLQAMSGQQSYSFDTKRHAPHRPASNDA